MSKTIKKYIFGLLVGCFLTVLTAACFALKPVTTFASANSGIAANEFTMENGASVRKSTPAGIRFTANIGSDIYAECFDNEGNSVAGKTLGMFIVPVTFYEEYATYKAENSDYVTSEEKYYDYFANVKKKIIDWRYSSDQVISKDGGYIIRGTISNLLFNNINREFLALAYVETATENEGVTTYSYRYADFTLDNARSGAYVAAAAVRAEETDEAGVLASYVQKSVYASMGVTYDESTKKYTYNEAEYDALTATNIDYSSAETRYGIDYLLEPYSDVTFLGEQMNRENLDVVAMDGVTSEGKIQYEKKDDYLDLENGNQTGISVIPTASYPHIYYTDLLPENDPGYDYYKWRLWSSIATTAQVGTKNVSLEKGWNSVTVTWSELKGADSKTWRIYVHALPTNTVAFGIGSLVGGEADVTFLDTRMTKENLVAHALNDPATSEGSLTAVELVGTLADSETTATVGYRLSAKQGAHLYYDALMPATDPGYDYYEWRFYNGYGSASITIEIGGTKFALLPGQWNTVTLTWAQLSGNGYIYFETEPATVVVIGSLTGFKKIADITFLGTAMTKENLVAHALNDPTTSEGTLTAVELTGTLADSETTATIGYRLTAAQWAHLYYDALMPETDPGYDYYEWRIYNGYDSSNITIEIGGTDFTLLPGQWNTVTLTWAQLNGAGQRIYFKTDPLSVVVIGSLSGFNKVVDITFLGTTMTKENLVAHALNDPTTSEGTLSPVELTGALADKATETLGYRLTAKQGAHLYYDALMPETDPGYDYYEWRFYNGYSVASITIEIGGTKFTLLPGQWNTVTLTWAQLSENGYIYFETEPASVVVIGSLVGCNNE